MGLTQLLSKGCYPLRRAVATDFHKNYQKNLTEENQESPYCDQINRKLGMVDTTV
jgi:hypothetical protein